MTTADVVQLSPRSLEHYDEDASNTSSPSSSPHREDANCNQHVLGMEQQQRGPAKSERKWVRKEKIGQGAQGCVYRCIEVATNREAACKVILLRDLSATEVTAIKREVSTIKKLKHPRLVKYWRATEVPRKRLSIYMEFVAGGALSSRLRREGALPMDLVKRFTRQLCEALGFLHQKGMAHRDIKCANVFLTSNDQHADIKLGDFGALKETGCASLVGGLKGTPHWMAPEVIRGGPPAPSDGDEDGRESWWFRADVWSLGCATLEMLTGHAPWRQYSNPHTAMYQIVVSNNTPAIPADASDETASFLHRCLQRDPQQRATIPELLTHPFLCESACTGKDSESATAHDTEPEMSPTTRSGDDASPIPAVEVSKAKRSKYPRGKDAEQDNPVQKQQHLSSAKIVSPKAKAPSRIPRLRQLQPVKMKVVRVALSPAQATGNNDHVDSDRSEKLEHPKEESTEDVTPNGKLPRLVVGSSCSKTRDFAIPKVSLLSPSTQDVGAAAPGKPAVVARRVARTISPLPPRRAMTAPPAEMSIDSNNSMEGGDTAVSRLKLPPLRAASASSCRVAEAMPCSRWQLAAAHSSS